jgi:predicted dehydrogenase
MSDVTYRVGIIGLGFIGGGDQVSGDRIGQVVANLDGTHRETLSKNTRVKLVAGCDLDDGRRERFTERTGATTYDDWRAMVENEQLDIVSVATTAPAHCAMSVGCAKAGVRAIYCEKPIATSITEAEQMIAACKEAGALLVVNHNRRFNPNYRELRERIAAGQLGELTSLSLRWSSGRLGCVGTHLVDAARMLTGREIVAVSATLDLAEKADCRGPEFHDPGGWGVMRMEGGLPIVINATNHAVGPAEIIIEGTDARAYTGGDVVIIRTFSGEEETLPGRRAEATSMDRTLAEIVEWLDSPGTFSTPAEESLKTFEAMIGFHISHHNNAAWIELPIAGEDREYRIVAG